MNTGLIYRDISLAFSYGLSRGTETEVNELFNQPGWRLFGQEVERPYNRVAAALSVLNGSLNAVYCQKQEGILTLWFIIGSKN
jgi:hypothetical protein